MAILHEYLREDKIIVAVKFSKLSREFHRACFSWSIKNNKSSLGARARPFLEFNSKKLPALFLSRMSKLSRSFLTGFLNFSQFQISFIIIHNSLWTYTRAVVYE